MLKLKIVHEYKNIQNVPQQILEEFANFECNDKEQFQSVIDGEQILLKIGVASENRKIVGFVVE